MIEFRDKGGRIVQVSTSFKGEGSSTSGGLIPDELMLELLRKVPPEEFIELPGKVGR